MAYCMATGDPWFYAWRSQKATPLGRLARQTGISPARLNTINAGDRVSRAEIDALARTWDISAGDLIALMPDPAMLVE